MMELAGGESRSMKLAHAAVELEELRRREKEQDTHPDPKIHAFMKVQADRRFNLGLTQILSCRYSCLRLPPRTRKLQAFCAPHELTDAAVSRAQADAKVLQKHSIATDYTLRMLGLEQAAATVVGNQVIR